MDRHKVTYDPRFPPQPALTMVTAENSHLRFLAFLHSYTFPASVAYCCCESSASSPLNIKLTLCADRKVWPYTDGRAQLDDVYFSQTSFFIFFVLEPFLVYCWAIWGTGWYYFGYDSNVSCVRPNKFVIKLLNMKDESKISKYTSRCRRRYLSFSSVSVDTSRVSHV